MVKLLKDSLLFTDKKDVKEVYAGHYQKIYTNHSQHVFFRENADGSVHTVGKTLNTNEQIFQWFRKHGL